MSAYALPILFPATSSLEERSITDEESQLAGEHKRQERCLSRARHKERLRSGCDMRTDIDVSVRGANVEHQKLAMRRQRCAGSSAFSISFELSIKLNGRIHRTKRCLALFIQLYDELVKECFMTGLYDVVIPELPKSPYDDGCSSEFDFDVTVPACSNVRVSGMGFSFVQNLWNGYIPKIERWLCTVCRIVPTSPCLTKFLLAPTTRQVSNMRKPRGIEHLEAINEDGDEEDYDYGSEFHDSFQQVNGVCDSIKRPNESNILNNYGDFLPKECKSGNANTSSLRWTQKSVL